VAVLEEIVVTATKRKERLFDVPLSVTALDGDSLVKRQLVSLADIAGQVPGLALQQTTATRNRLIIRGQNAGGAGATVAVVIDEVPFSKSNALSEGSFTTSDFYTYDMERVEVLRGPQGTLYGANAVGGLVKYVTRAPDPSGFGAAVEVSGFNVTDGGTGTTLRGFVNAPLGASAALRLVGFYDQLPGWSDNYLLGKEDADEGRRSGGRASLLFKLSDALTIRGTVSFNERIGDSPSFVNVFGQPNGSAVVPANRFDLPRGRGFGTYVPQREEAKQFNSYLNIDWNFGPATLTSITAYGTMKNLSGLDASGTLAAPGVNLLAVAAAPLYGTPLTATRGTELDTDKYSQEFRLSSTPVPAGAGSGFDWQVGLFGTKEKNDFVIPFVLRAFPSNQVLTTPFPGGEAIGPSEYKEVAGFGDLRVILTPRFDVSFGGRYTRTTQSVSTIFTPGIFSTGGGPAFNSGENSATQSKTTWSVAPRFKFSDDTMVYARIATGFRPGGPQQLVPGAPPEYPKEYQADTSTNFEVGLRSALFDRRFSIDVAAFYVDWKDIQIISVFTASNGQRFSATGNAGKARTQGLEWNFGWAPVDGLRFGLVGSYVDPKLKADAPALGAENGNRLPYVPKITTSFSASYDWSVGERTKMFAGGSWSHFGSFFTDFGLPGLTANYVELPSFNTLNVQTGLTRGPLSATLYVQNMTDKKALLSYASQGAPGSPLAPTLTGAFYGSGVILQPRTIGLRIGYTF
jgi:outer membrane receptor protein involved in Fe transport